MALQNIGAGNSDDAFYRYKMPKMVTKIEGRGNGIKTNIVNMVDVAKALARPPSYTTKYFGCELGAQSKFDEKTGVSLVNGSHDTAKLAGLLEIFIKKYVQCYGCGNPETEVLITKTQMVQLKCAACGFISDVDMRDKLTSFILKNPPEQKKSKDKKALRRAEKERLKEGEAADEENKKVKSKKKGKEVKPTSSPPADVADVDDDNIQWQTDTSAEAARQRVQEQLSAVTADMVMLLDEPEEVKTPHQILVEKVKEDLEKGVGPDVMMSALTGTRKENVNAVYEGLFDGVEKGFAKVVVKRRKYLAAVVADGEEGQMMLLGAVEEYCGKVKNPVAVKEVALVLKALYDADVVEEEYVVKWYEEGLKGGNKDSVIWRNAKPFVEWLQSAESESE
ncbi:eukaryotic translation initiation factor 5 [Lactuca sativa]|uniref:eukaryotic translation initiation factor 5 n=1 Tax=Lactuca sativa TaxID=4236 RepID=UPI000CC40F6E|nr:eukaryotic translation initiation factor 5 [Lactuca sativa]